MQFNEDNQDFQGEQVWEGSRQSWMNRLVMKTGLVKSGEQANYVLMGIAVVFFAITVVIVMGIGGSDTQPAPASVDDIPPEVREQLPPEILREIENAQ